MFSGFLLFSGNLYLLSLTGMELTRPAIPIGGLVLIVAWLSLAIGGMRLSSSGK
jgi:uncharacterized membrane protein YgdD (TMEM256/DUF423 family)